MDAWNEQNQVSPWEWKRLQNEKKELMLEKEKRTGKIIDKEAFLKQFSEDHSDLERNLKERQLKRAKTVANTPGFRSRKKKI